MPSTRTETPLPGRSAGVGEYLKQAFLYRWNMLLFLGGVGAAALSPWPDAVLPLVAAAEAAYLGGMISSTKFRKAIDALVHRQAKDSRSGSERTRSIQDIV